MRTLIAAAWVIIGLGNTVTASAQLPRPGAAQQISVATLKSGQAIHGFTTLCVYTGDGGRPIGARFRHVRTGYIFDYLQMDSVPQAFIYVNTPPTSDKGEPHTQEHLLLGKGNRGRAVASAETLTMSASSAYTEQWRTCFFFDTTAGPDVFYGQLEMRLDALLHPDYTDEEVRREVRNFGVADNPDGTLRLEEKGTVYNEMVSTMDKSGSQLYRAMGADVYGASHPLAYEAGGTPEALRTLTPDEIRAFRTRDYYLGNMGMVASFPSRLPLTGVLSRVGQILTDLQPGPALSGLPPVLEPTFPSPKPALSRAAQVVMFPDENAQQPGDVGLAWPADRSLALSDYLTLQLFLENVASDADTPLYKRFIDTKTRSIETGATNVYAYISDDEGFPIYVGLSDVKPSSVSATGIDQIRRAVTEEFSRIAAWPDGSQELLAFNAKLKTRLLAYRRDQSKFVNSPPGFGARGTSSAWMDQCRLLERTPGFRKSVLMTPELEVIDSRLSTKKNIWRTLLAEWKISGVTPYAVGTRADPALVARQAAERAARNTAEVALLRAKYHSATDQEAIRRYKADYDAETSRQAVIAAQAKSGSRFLRNPPLTLDDDLKYTISAGKVPVFAATFDTMTSTTVRLNLPLTDVREDELVYLAALPELLDDVGVIENGKPLSYEETLERQRREILSIGCSFDTNPYRGRYELEVTGAGNNAAESKRAAGWMKTLLKAPNWRRENLPRLRDVIDQALQRDRNRMLEQEEFWVSGVGTAWRYQTSPLALTTGSFLTQTHHLHRLRWMLKEAPTAADASAFTDFLSLLSRAATVDGPTGVALRPGLEALLKLLQGGSGAATADLLPSSHAVLLEACAKLPAGAKPLAMDAARDLAVTISTLPDDSLGSDWTYLCSEMAADFKQGPDETLRRLDALRVSLLLSRGARLTLVGASTTETALKPALNDLVSVLAIKLPSEDSKPPHTADAPPPRITERLRGRIPEAQPVFVGLVAPSMKGGVVMNEAPSASYLSADDYSLLRLLAGNLYGGGGADSIFIKTWGAGLAYSNGIGHNLGDGSVSYYADHTPEIPQTVRFVIDTVKASPRKPDLVEYSLADSFQSRAGAGYEARAFAMADDLADGLTPAVVKSFRTRLLALRAAPGLLNDIYGRLPGVMGAILPGYATVVGNGPTGAPLGAHYFAIGPEKQMAAYEGYLKSATGSETVLYRLYPRDFWIPRAMP